MVVVETEQKVEMPTVEPQRRVGEGVQVGVGVKVEEVEEEVIHIVGVGVQVHLGEEQVGLVHPRSEKGKKRGNIRRVREVGLLGVLRGNEVKVHMRRKEIKGGNLVRGIKSERRRRRKKGIRREKEPRGREMMGVYRLV